MKKSSQHSNQLAISKQHTATLRSSNHDTTQSEKSPHPPAFPSPNQRTGQRAHSFTLQLTISPKLKPHTSFSQSIQTISVLYQLQHIGAISEPYQSRTSTHKLMMSQCTNGEYIQVYRIAQALLKFYRTLLDVLGVKEINIKENHSSISIRDLAIDAQRNRGARNRVERKQKGRATGEHKQQGRATGKSRHLEKNPNTVSL